MFSTACARLGARLVHRAGCRSARASPTGLRAGLSKSPGPRVLACARLPAWARPHLAGTQVGSWRQQRRRHSGGGGRPQEVLASVSRAADSTRSRAADDAGQRLRRRAGNGLQLDVVPVVVILVPVLHRGSRAPPGRARTGLYVRAARVTESLFIITGSGPVQEAAPGARLIRRRVWSAFASPPSIPAPLGAALKLAPSKRLRHQGARLVLCPGNLRNQPFRWGGFQHPQRPFDQTSGAGPPVWPPVWSPACRHSLAGARALWVGSSNTDLGVQASRAATGAACCRPACGC